MPRPYHSHTTLSRGEIIRPCQYVGGARAQRIFPSGVGVDVGLGLSYDGGGGGMRPRATGASRAGGLAGRRYGAGVGVL